MQRRADQAAQGRLFPARGIARHGLGRFLGRYGNPFEMVTAEKQRRLRRAAESWLGARPELARLAVGFDVIAVRDGRVQRVPQAF